MRTDDGNKLLRILHGRRVAGTLDDPTFMVNTMHFSAKDRKLALGYLRRRVPVDEVVNAGLRAEDELAALENQDGAQDDSAADGSQPSQPNSSKSAKDSVYGVGAFDAIRARNKAKHEAEQIRLAEEKKALEEANHTDTSIQVKVDADKGVRVVQRSAKMEKWLEQGQSKLEAPPELKLWERLLPSTIFVALLIGGFAAFAEFYRPPSRKDRLFPDVPPAAATVLGLIAANLLVFGAWRIPPLWGFMNRYFILVVATPKPVQFLGAMFSHQQVGHLLTNMGCLWFFGVRYHDEVGRGNFLATYFSCGALAYLLSFYSFVLRGKLSICSIGASGAIYGIMGAYLWLHRFGYFKVFDMPPEPYRGVQGLAWIGLLAGINITGWFSKSHMIDVTTHMGGLGVGIAMASLIERRREARTRARLEMEEEKGRSAAVASAK